MIEEVTKQRFWSQVTISATRSYNGTACLEWTGKKNHLGYGNLCYKGKTYNVSRFFWMHVFGRECPREFDVHHLCENKACVNLDHLESLTHKEHRAKHGWKTWQERNIAARMWA